VVFLYFPVAGVVTPFDHPLRFLVLCLSVCLSVVLLSFSLSLSLSLEGQQCLAAIYNPMTNKLFLKSECSVVIFSAPLPARIRLRQRQGEQEQVGPQPLRRTIPNISTSKSRNENT
jgi:hypothetical protein